MGLPAWPLAFVYHLRGERIITEARALGATVYPRELSFNENLRKGSQDGYSYDGTALFRLF